MSERSRAEERMIHAMTKRGGKGFRILRSPETRIRRHQRDAPTPPPDATPDPVGETSESTTEERGDG